MNEPINLSIAGDLQARRYRERRQFEFFNNVPPAQSQWTSHGCGFGARRHGPAILWTRRNMTSVSAIR